MVEWAGLENRYARKSIGGSNPPASAKESDMETTSEFIWIFGTSCAGKYTLIRSIRANGNFLSQRLNLKNNIVVCEESLNLVGDRCPTNETRNILLDVLTKIEKSNKPILIKGQAVDLYTNNLPQKLHMSFPNALHRILFLWVDPEKLRERWKHRGRENPANAENAQKEQFVFIKMLEGKFDVTYLNSTDINYISLK